MKMKDNIKRIGILGAMDSEVETLKNTLQDRKELQAAGMTFYYGTLAGFPAVVAQCGIGKVCAAMGAQAMIDHFTLIGLINTGVAGGLHRDLEVGDIVLSVDAIQHDFDVTAFGYPKGYISGMGPSDRPSRFVADEGLKEIFRAVASSILVGQKFIEGTIVSGDVFVDNTELKRELIAQFDASAAELEGAAIAQVAHLNHLPFLVIRAISDLAEKKANVSFDTFVVQAAETSARLVLAMCERFAQNGDSAL